VPDASEGDLARSRSRIVSEVALAPVAAALGVGEALRLGRGEESSGGREKPSLLADALEALIGACYLERGLGAAQSLIDALLGERIAEVLSDPGSGDHKGRLQELATRLALEPPRYEVRESGPDHAKRFFAEVFTGDQLLGTGHGRSKKNAELEAADRAVALLSSRFGGA
jgi:ribonuclease-3